MFISTQHGIAQCTECRAFKPLTSFDVGRLFPRPVCRTCKSAEERAASLARLTG